MTEPHWRTVIIAVIVIIVAVLFFVYLPDPVSWIAGGLTLLLLIAWLFSGARLTRTR
jgi:predicted Na+-dependent transporter